MRVGFAGTPDFARQALRAIAEAGFQVPLVLTQPDRPAGRGLKLQPSPVKQLATSLKLPLQQPRGLRLDGRFGDDALGAQRALHDAALDVLVVAAYGLILPPWVLALPGRGCLNIHGSLLPRWRGAAPIQRAIEAGDAQTGITIMQMDAGLDTGPMLCRQALPILDDDTTATLHDRLASLGAGLMVEALQHIDSLVPTPQPEAGANYAAKIDKAEAMIDWAAPAALIERRIRAFDPFPGCHFMLHGETVKVWRAELVDRSAEPGRVLAAHGELVVACGAQALSLRTLQRTGGRRVAVGDFLHGHAVAAGTRL